MLHIIVNVDLISENTIQTKNGTNIIFDVNVKCQ